MALKLKFLDKARATKEEVLINQYGNLRFKQMAIDEFNIEKGQRWLIATDENESTVQHLYLVRANDEDKRAFKVTQGSSSLYINMIGVVHALKLATPLKCSYESFSEGKYQGVKIILPKNSKAENKKDQ